MTEPQKKKEKKKSEYYTRQHTMPEKVHTHTSETGKVLETRVGIGQKLYTAMRTLLAQV